MSFIFGDDPSTSRTTSSSNMPGYVKSASKSAIQTAEDIADQPYQPYEGPRVASLSEPQQKAVSAAEGQIGKYQPAFASAQETLEGATETAQQSADRQFTDEVSKYMSPYIEQAIEPTLRELRDQNAQMTNQQRAEMVRGGGRGAYGGARAAIMDAEQAERTQQTMADVLKEGYQSAFEQAGDLFAQDVGLQREGAQLEGAMAEQQGRLAGQEATVDRSGIQAALQAGELPRQVEQASYDRAYQDYLEQRDWNERGLDAYLRALRGTPYEETTVQRQSQQASTGQQIGQLAGAVTAGVGAYNTFF
jgi:hypothetical protein